MKNNVAIAAAAVIGLNLVIYLATPYYSAWRIMQSVSSGSPAQMERYIDFPSVQSSLRQQVDSAFTAQAEKDPMVAAFAPMIRQALDSMIDELVQPDKLAELIHSGKLQPAPARPDKTGTARPGGVGNGAAELDWYAFFDRPDRFRISAGDLSLYMEMRQWRWQLTAIGIDGLLDMDAPRGQPVASADAASAEPVAEEIDTHSPPPPRSNIDREALRERLAKSFFITGDFSDKAMVEGDFHYTPVPPGTEIEVTWLDARDADGNPVLGSFTEQELKEREKFRSGKGIFQGQWQDKLPKSSADASVATASGQLKLQLPARIEHISLDGSQLNQLQVQGDVAANLTQMENGSLSLSLYQPHDQAEVEPLVYIRNAQGQPLRKPSASSVTPTEPVEKDEFPRPMRSTRISYSVAGTPASVDIYFPLGMEEVEVEFTATQKPEVLFGELKAPILQTRYAAPRPEQELSPVDAGVLDGIEVELVEETTWDNKSHTSLQFTLPELSNSVFARVEYGNLQVFKDGQAVEFTPSQSRSGTTEYSVSFQEDTDSFNSAYLVPDRITGSITLSYPARAETVRVNQGETFRGATLDGAQLSYPKDGEFPRYSSVFNPRSASAFDSDGRRIAYLPGGDYWDDDSYSLYFWGEPDHVELKAITEWVEKEIPVDLSLDDLQSTGDSRG
ncbi:DUF2939 domain-containing protein [Microbulbifer sediminum]|uniref:DUF2939 domain-containing protein n=1 Tax=Microbulbifer sediminum TaxID=2904250 RepID=UPI001F4101B2|nr:DUF2939 domain-containing protein [Microbulbifer sediminum]